MLPYKNDRILKAIRHEPIDRTPIWIMRQAGRYLPEYRATRQQAGSFLKLCKTPELACEVTLQPLRRYPLDAAIIFSDILTIPDAMGLELAVIEGKGPVFSHPLDTAEKIQTLSLPDPARLDYVYAAIKLVKQALNNTVPLIGFCGSPWTLAAYMVQGHSVPGFPLLMSLKQKNPFLLQHLLSQLAVACANHLQAQAEAGADILMIFDTWGSLLNTEEYPEYSLDYIKRIIHTLKQHYNNSKPIILFTKNNAQWLEMLGNSGCDMLGLSWDVSLDEARTRLNNALALQGNMNPACLLQSPPEIVAEVARILASYGKGSGHVFNLGHGITPDVPPEHLAILIDAVHELSQPYHVLNKKV